MTNTLDQSPPPLHDSMPPLGVSAEKNELMGFRLGSSFESHKSAFEALETKGFEAPPAANGQPFQRFMLERVLNAESNLELALTFEYEDKQLKRIGLVVTRETKNQEEPIEVLHDLGAALVEALGTPHLVLDRTLDWSKQNVQTQDPSLAYAMFWSGSKTVPPKATTTTESTRFFDALLALSHDGALASITGVLGSVIASVDFFQGQPASAANTTFLSFIKRR